MAGTRYQGIFLLWLCCLWTAVQADDVRPFDTLPTGAFIASSDGNFILPAPNSSTSIFDEGSIMTITWDTSYPSVNLYNQWRESIYPGGVRPANTQLQIATGAAGNSITWTVTCKPDCTRPFTLHAVNAEGTDEEQLTLGFYSRLYWIRPADFSSSSSSSAAPTSSSTSTSSATSSATSVTSEVAATGTAQPIKDPDDDDDNTTAIGAGVGVGVGVVIALIGGFLPLAALPEAERRSCCWASGRTTTTHGIERMGAPLWAVWSVLATTRV